MSEQPLYGLIGFPLTHSFSPAYFKNKFEQEHINAEYRSFPISNVQQLNNLLEEYPNLKGLNVTIPYKEEVIPYLYELDPNAAAIKAVNCIHIVSGKTIGYNTDIIGFANSLSPLLLPYMDKALILGSGGAAKAVRFVLDKLGIAHNTVSRSGKEQLLSYTDITDEIIETHPLIINTTPLGMHPNEDNYPEIPYYAMSEQHLVFDLVYNPTKTKFLQFGEQHGATIQNGLPMLQMQADASWQIWNS